MNLNARKNEIEARLAEIRGLVDKETDTEKLSAYEKECDDLQNERSQIVAKLNIADKTIVKPIVVEKNSVDKTELEARAKSMREGRTITVAADEILLPNHVDTTLAPYPFL